jgi:FtsH-binding integral membrane protein
MTLGVALVFAAIYLFGGRASERFGERNRRRFLSFAAGLSVSYTFVHILPGLHQIREFQTNAQTDYIQRVFPEYSVYLAAMIGFLVFYGLESMPVGRRQEGDNIVGHPSWQAWIHISGFALYTWLITFLSVRTGKGLIALCVFAVAMGMHLAPITNRLRSEYPAVYKIRGAVVLALACLAGWGCGLTLNLPVAVVLDMVAVVAGGVIVNAAIAELPKEREASFWSFFTGAGAYTALLLALSHFEKNE